ncbi:MULTISPECIES: hypothetical protein [unclassified Sphingobacterium]|uniref:hypothetical protein n=1 Tax=unclassified Sphingobacterium TaxID=2609468 RepID=UPI0025987994|nr:MULTISPECIES: hypothetical protein [unclassified Sphingobacterium]
MWKNIILGLFVSSIGLSCSKNETQPEVPDEVKEPRPVNTGFIPPETIQENWKEHVQLIKRVNYNDSVAIYYDDDMPRSVTWIAPFTQKVWSYIVKNYGDMHGNSKDRLLYGIFHKNKYGGGHPFFYDNADHGYRNGIDIGASGNDAWEKAEGWNIDIICHELIHLIEFVSHNKSGSPSRKWWGDSKIAEIINYDIYMGLGMEAEAQRIYQNDINKSENFPSQNTLWLKNWFFPIYNNHGKTAALTGYFKLLADHFPQNAKGQYARDMTFGEFVHFWSAAAKANLKNQAILAFGWNAQWEREWKEAQVMYPNFDYAY